MGLRRGGLRAGGDARGELAAGAVELTASLLLCGVDPLPILRSANELELRIVHRALERTVQLRQEEQHSLARQIRNEIGELIGGKKRSG